MKVQYEIFAPKDLPANRAALDAFRKFCFSSGITDHPVTTIARLSTTDPRLTGLLDTMKSHGFELRPEAIQPSHADPLRHLRWIKLREYEHADLVNCEYLLLASNKSFSPSGWIQRNEKNGLLRFWGQDVPDAWRTIDCGHPVQLICTFVISDRLRIALEKADLHGLVIRPITVHEYYLKWNPPVLWEMDSWLAMPLVSPDMKIADGMNGDSIDNLDPRIVRRRPVSEDGGRRYRRSDFPEAKLSFDIRRTVEPWFGPAFVRARLETPMVVSQKFYQVCRSVGEFGHWSPVRIE